MSNGRANSIKTYVQNGPSINQDECEDDVGQAKCSEPIGGAPGDDGAIATRYIVVVIIVGSSSRRHSPDHVAHLIMVLSKVERRVYALEPATVAERLNVVRTRLVRPIG